MRLTISAMLDGIKNGFEWDHELRVYPLTMREYEFNRLILTPLEYMQQLFPIKYLGMSYIRALHKMSEDMEEHKDDIVKFMILLARSFRISTQSVYFATSPEGDVLWYVCMAKDKNGNIQPAKSEYCINIIRGTADKDTLREWGIYTITEAEFYNLRELICCINAADLPDEEVNPEIWQSMQDIKRQNAEKLNYNTSDLIFSYAEMSGKSIDEIMDMTLWEFHNRVSARDRIVNHELCTAAQFSGTKFKEGNPFPDWRYEKHSDNKMGMSTYTEIQQKMSKVTGNNI